MDGIPEPPQREGELLWFENICSQGLPDPHFKNKIMLLFEGRTKLDVKAREESVPAWPLQATPPGQTVEAMQCTCVGKEEFTSCLVGKEARAHPQGRWGASLVI